MEIKAFAKKVQNALERELGSNYKVEVKEVRKNNGIILHGLLIQPGSRNVVPTIYLDAFWEAYEEGMPFAVIMRRLAAVYREGMPDEDVDMEYFKFFEKVKERICYRLINREENEELLEEMPHIAFLDLAICFYYAYQGKALGEGSILINNSHVDMWKTSTAELLALAEINTPRLYPCSSYSMQDILREIAEQESAWKKPEAEIELLPELPMRVLSNVKRTYGAVCMIYPGVLEQMAGKCGQSCYILPSSVHEVIFLRDIGTGSESALRKMIMEINRTQVAPEEVLSDQLYRYDVLEKQIKIVSK